jgi:hypothetical protein
MKGDNIESSDKIADVAVAIEKMNLDVRRPGPLHASSALSR